MAFSATFSASSSPCFNLACKTRRPSLSQSIYFTKPSAIRASTTLDYANASVDGKPSSPLKTNDWQWRFKENLINIYYEEHVRENDEPSQNILLLPTISDVSTVEEWRVVAGDIIQRDSKVNWRATIVDWPGLGYSGRPKIDYNADVLEKFLVDFINAPNSPVSHPENNLVIFGGGHAASIVIRAAKKGLVKPKAIAAVAPTWAGPLPIVFGRDSSMETRYGFLRGTLKAPAIGWMMYNMFVSNEKAIQSQYKSHVYADPDNVTPGIVESRYALTKREGARYLPAAFLTGLLDPVKSREQFLEIFAGLEGKLPILVVSTKGSPKRSKAEMEALRGAKGVSKFVELPGALLPQEEYPIIVAEELYQFLQENFESKV
ncbi:alpha/beta-Hydrolases superfamily protein [Quillaja saponaria]|uniref:Alpha/beta-Hydrolases superfamily protein n=1 Tax=Quillaja saponaria TaxID=32244 RepID=A0AAD7LDZ2_QUISA|nr:alpha/beta-Hydrolases superfamily protein [Quillaja saponaria]